MIFGTSSLRMNSYLFGIKAMSHARGYITGMIRSLHPTDETRRYKVTPLLIGWAQT